MFTVIDQHRPWLTPSRRFAATTHDQSGAAMTMNGTGRPMSQPATSTHRRPNRSDNRPANRLASAFDGPNAAMNEVAAAAEAIPKSSPATSGRTLRSTPTSAPTNALIATSSANCRQFARRPRRSESTG
jgi:hypothetical protein